LPSRRGSHAAPAHPSFETETLQEKEEVMNSLKKVVLWLLATSLVFAAAAVLIPKKAVALLATNVFVTNPSVPVTGDVGISGTPTVQLAPGTMVGVTGGTFNFSNTPSTPIFTRDKDNPALAPFQTRLCDGTGSNCSFTFLPGVFAVGANQRLVIEYVSLQCAAGSGSSVTEADVLTTAGGNPVTYPFLPGQANGSGKTIANQQVRIYADPGTGVFLFVQNTGPAGLGTGSVTCIAALSGNLVTP
jgi:hypothetical protein